jgi:membrane-associated phospholipid phosphatase
MERWEPWVRASVIDFELVSRLGFSQAGGRMSVWQLETTPGAGNAPPNCVYRPLFDITRPDKDKFKKLLVFLDRYADLRGDRASEILSQLGGAIAFLSSVAFLHPDRTHWTLELLAAALRLANFTEMRLKQALACRRPNEYSPQVQPMIATPSHGSFPSGHATEAFTSAFVLFMLLRSDKAPPAPPNTPPTQPYGDPSWGTQLMRLAARVAINRTIAGVHFPVDSAAGAVLGLTLGQYFVNRCTGAANYTAWAFDGTQFPDPTQLQAPPLDGDFYWHELFDETVPAQTQTPYATPTAVAQVIPADPLLAWLWGKAKAEWN